ncbi:MAG: bifunctional pyr operon transcriptional regulator/uracil phosphoribosyltransferase PyrR [Nitrosomonas sp.]|nr:bifunctional pyr operon transcriptional regulator/uracil phosphoribosyltransferase PyrR [Nitrosomonas sp.]
MNKLQRQLPDAEIIFADLVKKIRPDIKENVALVGIRTGGMWLAERLHRELALSLPLGMLDVSFYRDDFDKIGLHPEVKPSDLPFEVAGSHIILVDDVIKTGRTIRAAVNGLFDYGRPASICVAVLIDRGERELPITARYVGLELTLPSEKVLRLQQGDDGRFSLNLFEKHDPE